MQYYLNQYMPIISDEKSKICFPLTGNDTYEVFLEESKKKYFEQLLKNEGIEENILTQIWGNQIVDIWKEKDIIVPYKIDCDGRNSRINSYCYLKKLGNLREVLETSRVLILGCGGVGSHTAWNLVTLGVKEVFLLDYDVIEESNLNRQLIYDSSDIGKKKVEVLAQKLKLVNPEVNFYPVQCCIKSKKMLQDLITNIKPHCIVKSLDFPIYISEWIDAVCKETNTKYVSGIMNGTKQLLGPTYVGKGSAQFGDFFSFNTNAEKISGIGPSLSFELAQMGAEVAEEVFKLLTSHGKLRFKNRLLMYENLTNERIVLLPSNYENDRESYKVKTLYNFLLILIFLLTIQIVNIPRPIVVLGITLYSLLIPPFISGSVTEAVAYCFKFSSFGMIINIATVAFTNRVQLQTLSLTVTTILVGFTVLSLLIMIIVSLERLFYAIVSKISIRMYKEKK